MAFLHERSIRVSQQFTVSYSITGYGDDDGKPMRTQFREMKTLMRRAFLSFLRANDTTPSVNHLRAWGSFYRPHLLAFLDF